MSYRRSDSSGAGTPRWRARNRAFLLSCGIPDAILDSDRSLTYVLLHGDDEVGTGWSHVQLTPEQAARLLAFLESEQLSEGYDLVNLLRKSLLRLAPPT
jgi:hypothetical protein